MWGLKIIYVRVPHLDENHWMTYHGYLLVGGCLLLGVVHERAPNGFRHFVWLCEFLVGFAGVFQGFQFYANFHHLVILVNIDG